MNTKFKGLGVAMITPFNADGSIDFVGLEKLTLHLINGGVNSLSPPNISSSISMLIICFPYQKLFTQ